MALLLAAKLAAACGSAAAGSMCINIIGVPTPTHDMNKCGMSVISTRSKGRNGSLPCTEGYKGVVALSVVTKI